MHIPTKGGVWEHASPENFFKTNALKLNLGHSGGVLHISKYHIHENFRLRIGYLIVFYSNPRQPHGGAPCGGGGGGFDLLEHFRKHQDSHMVGLS